MIYLKVTANFSVKWSIASSEEQHMVEMARICHSKDNYLLQEEPITSRKDK